MTRLTLAMSEKDLERAVRDLAALFGWRLWHPWLAIHSPRGFPDLVLLRARDRRLIFAELKTERGQLRPAQREWLAELGALEFDARPVRHGVAIAANEDAPALWTLELGRLPVPTIQVFVWRPKDLEQIAAVLR